jgi:segregation and condensation protein B
MERENDIEEEAGAADAEPASFPESSRRRLRSILESLLFATAEPVSIGKLVQVLRGYEKKDVTRTLGELREEYARDERGFRLQEVAGGFQLRTSSGNAEFVKALREQRPARLSRAALETLAVVAYRQPVTKPEMEAIRGVDVDAVLTGLLERRLIRILGRKDVPGRPLLYGTTPEFLETFGLKDLSSLPTLEELGASADALERAASVVEANAAASEGTPAPAEPEAVADSASAPPVRESES